MGVYGKLCVYIRFFLEAFWPMRLKGKIKRVEAGRGNGHITSEDGRDFFFHRTHLEGLDFEKLRPGDEVEFEFDEFRGPTTPKAPVATVVRPAGGSKKSG